MEAFGSNDKIYDPENIPGYNLVKEIIIKDVEAFPAGAVVYAMEVLLSLEEFNHFMAVAISVDANFDISVFPKKYQSIKKQVDIVSYVMEHDIQYNQKIQAYKYLNNEFRSILTEKETDPRILDKLSKDNYKDVRRYVAANNNTSPVTLDLLAKDNEEYVRRNVAKNKNTSPETLDLLAKDNEEYVRRNVAENNNTSSETLALLSKDNNVYVRQNVAGNNNTPQEALALLAEDNDVSVRRLVASNNNTSQEILAIFAKDSDKDVRKNVAKNNNTPQETLALLAKDSDKGVRQAVTKNKNVTPEILTLIDEYEAAKPKRILPPIEFPKKEFDNNYIINFGTEEQRLKFIDSNPPINDLKSLAKHFNISYKVELKLLDLNNDEIDEILLENYAVDPEIKKIILGGRDGEI